MKILLFIISFALIILLTNIPTIASDKILTICKDSGNIYFPASEKSKYHNDDDGTLICWLEDRNNGSLYIQKIGLLNIMEWDENGIMIDDDLETGFTAETDYPLIFSDNKGGAVIIYRKVSGSREDIYMQKVSEKGIKLTNATKLSSFYNGFNYSPAAVLTKNNEIAIAWENFIDGNFDIHAQKTDLEANKLWNNGNEIIVCNNRSDQRKPTITSNDNNELFIVWLDSRNYSEYAFDLYANRISNKGMLLEEGGEGKLIFRNTPNSGKDNMKEVFYNHNIIPSDKNSFMVACEKYRENQNNVIQVIKISRNLNEVWGTHFVPVSREKNPLIVSSLDYGANVIWNNQKNGDNEIYRINIEKNGKISGGFDKGEKISCDEMKIASGRILPPSNNRNGIYFNNNNIYVSWITSPVNKLFLSSINLTDESVQCENTSKIQDDIHEGGYTSITTQKNNLVVVYYQSNSLCACIRELSENRVGSSDHESIIENFPNPFNPSTAIHYKILSDGFVKLSVYDINGKIINTLVNEFQPSGNYKATFDGSNLATGVYFYKLETHDYITTKKMTLLR